MSNYTKATNFTQKDGLSTGDPNKIIKGSEIDAEYPALASAVNPKAIIISLLPIQDIAKINICRPTVFLKYAS